MCSDTRTSAVGSIASERSGGAFIPPAMLTYQCANSSPRSTRPAVRRPNSFMATLEDITSKRYYWQSRILQWKFAMTEAYTGRRGQIGSMHVWTSAETFRISQLLAANSMVVQNWTLMVGVELSSQQHTGHLRHSARARTQASLALNRAHGRHTAGLPREASSGGHALPTHTMTSALIRSRRFTRCDSSSKAPAPRLYTPRASSSRCAIAGQYSQHASQPFQLRNAPDEE